MILYFIMIPWYKIKIRFLSSLLIIGVATILGGGIVLSAAKNSPPIAQTITEEERLVSLIDKALPSVVNVVGSQQNDDGTKTIVSRGSGFIVDASGLVLTNKHVVSSQKLTYTVYLLDGRRHKATIVGRDPMNDLAILKIPGEKLPILKLGNSDAIRIGQTTIAIGNTLGRYANSVTKGIVSGIGRNITASDNAGTTESLDDVIQTDAAINLGNSGGPLLNSNGEVIGINVAIEQQGRGVSFAIPSNEGAKALSTYKKYGHIVRPYLGLRYISITPDFQEAKKLAYDYGALVSAGDESDLPTILTGGPAEKAGIKEGDIILSINGTLIRNSESLRKIIQRFEPKSVILLYLYRNGRSFPIEVTLDEAPAN